jgi:HEAT repeat protein
VQPTSRPILLLTLEYLNDMRLTHRPDLVALVLITLLGTSPRRGAAQPARGRAGCIGSALIMEMSAARARSRPVAAWAAQVADRTVDPNDEAYENSNDPAQCRRLAVLALGFHGADAVPVLIRNLRTGLGTPFEVPTAVYDAAFSRIGAPAVEPLMALLTPAQAALSGVVLEVLASMGPSSLSATQTRLIALFPQLPVAIQSAALSAIAAAGPHTPQRLSLLLGLAQTAPDVSIRALALRSLRPFGSAAHPADAAIVTALSSSTPDLREAALLLFMGDAWVPHVEGTPTYPGIGTPDAAVPTLIRMLSDSLLGEGAELALERAGPIAVPSYRLILAGSNDVARGHVLDVIASSDPQLAGTGDLVPEVAHRIDADTGVLRLRGIAALEHIGGSTPTGRATAMTALRRLLQHRDQNTRARAAESMITVFGDTAGVISLLIAKLATDPVDDRSAVRGLVKTGAAATAALYEATHAPRPETRALAIDALGDIRPFASATMTVMIAALRDPAPLVRGYAAFNLANAEAEGRDALPALTTALRDPDANVRRSAAATIAKIHGFMDGSH